MKNKLTIPSLLSTICLISAPVTSFAEVKSLSSSELTETYIQDSTIIVTPKIQTQETTQKTYSSLTIAPVENDDQDIGELKNSQEHLKGTKTAFALSDELLRNSSVESALNPLEQVSIQSYQESITVPVADLLDDERYRVPEGEFKFDYRGDDLGLARNGDQLTISIGNLPEINQINLPMGIDEGPVQLVPRAGGGFDLTFDIPQNN